MMSFGGWPSLVGYNGCGLLLSANKIILNTIMISKTDNHEISYKKFKRVNALVVMEFIMLLNYLIILIIIFLIFIKYSFK